MKVSEFHYELPAELIAQHPLPERSASRLLCLDRATGELRDARFTDLPNLLREGDLLVFNDTRVIPARLHAHKASGGKAEILIERLLGAREALAQVKARRSPKPGSLLVLDGAGERGPRIEVTARDDSFFTLRLKSGSFIELLNTLGHVPLPPYIQREDDAADRERYQTVYARKPGAVAAPTAGLHFDDALLARLNQAGIARGFVTLHVGAGTFQPVRVREVEKHRMHAERIEVPPDLCRQAGETRRRGGRVIAVGTTAVRSLEAASRDGELRPFAGDSRLFIYPGYEFRAVDGMITNFHLPESTLLMLVSAFGGRERVRAAYAHAVRQEYRFYSYGDAMLIL